VNNKKKDRYIIPFDDIPSPRVKMPCIDLDDAVCSFTEVETGLTDELARQEALRCLSCRRCLGCALCWAECDSGCIVFEQTSEPFEVNADSVIMAPGAVRKPARIAGKYGYQDCLNVITDLQFERILAKNGPYEGQVMRPYDGDIPASIGFVLTIEPKDARSGQAYHVLLYGLKEAAEALKNQSDLKVTFYIPAGYDFIEKFRQLLSERAIPAEIVEGDVDSVTGAVETADVTIEAGGSNYEEGLVVLLSGFDLPEYMKELNRRLGLKIEAKGFWESGTPELQETEVAGVSLAGFRFSD